MNTKLKIYLTTVYLIYFLIAIKFDLQIGFVLGSLFGILFEPMGVLIGAFFGELIEFMLK